MRKLKERHDYLQKKAPAIGDYTPPKMDEDGFTEMQLWEVMSIFGKYLSCGDQPFDANIKINIK